MAAENEIQFFEAPFQYQIGEFTSNVNLTYHKLINTRPIKMPQLNTWFETNFSQIEREKWDKSYFWVTKRKWFIKVNQWLNEAAWEWLWWEYDYIITDQQIVNWERFLMVCDITFTKMCILHSQKWNNIDCMPQPQNIENASWDVEWQSYSWWTWRPFVTTPCSYHRFQKIPTLQTNSEVWNIGSAYIWTVVWNWWWTQSVLFSEDRTIIDNLSTWKYVQLYWSWEDTDIVVWQALQVWRFDWKNWWYNMWYWSWIWVTQERSEEVYDEEWNVIWTLNFQWPVNCHIYDDVKLWIAFAWSRTLSSWDERYWIWERDWWRFVFQYQTRLNNTQITSLTEDFDWLVYTTDKWVLNFMRPHNSELQTLWWTIYSTHQMYWNWDLAKACWDYIFLFWPDTMWIAYKNWTDERWDYRWNIQVLDRNLWYWNKDSVLVFNEELYMIDNKKRFVKLDLEATTDSYYRVHFKLKATDMSLHWINTDLRNLDRNRWEKVFLCKDAYRIYIIINDSYDTNDWEDENEVTNTKILVYEDELKYWHWWYMCWLDIRWYHDWTWYWRWLFSNEWEYDCDLTKYDLNLISEKNREKYKLKFKQIISMTFWDTSWFTWKEVLWIKAAIWYHSKISENTIFKFRADWWWYSTTFKMINLHKTSAYIKAINKLRESWTTNMEDLETIYRAMPIWIWIYSWNWVWLIKDKYRTPKTEFEQFCDYEPTMTYKTDTCCDAKPASEEDGNGCTMKAPDADAQNFGSDRFQYHYNIAKYSTIPIGVWQQWQNFYFELIANEYDSIEFLWFMIWWMFMDNNFDSIANAPYYQTTPKDSLPWMIWK